MVKESSPINAEPERYEGTHKWIEGFLLFDFVGVFSLLYLLWLIAVQCFGESAGSDRDRSGAVHGAADGGSGGARPMR